MRTSSKALTVLLLGFGATLAPAPAYAAAPKRYINCTALQHDFAHGVARAGAVDKVKGRTKPVTTFTVNPAAYNANKRLDRDKDGVACERR
jgi:hypothetical protein